MTVIKFAIFGPYLMLASILVDLIVFYANLFTFPANKDDQNLDQEAYIDIISKNTMNIFETSLKQVV